MSDFDLDVLVAFSGEIEDDGICEYGMDTYMLLEKYYSSNPILL